MTNWQDPTRLLEDEARVKSVWHVIIGAYLWEWFMSLPFDFQKISHPREWQWPLLVYLLARFGGLATAVTTIIFFNTAQEYNCEAALRINIVFGYLSIAMSSCLMALRTIAIWRRQWAATIIVVALWLANFGGLLRGIIKDDVSTWNVELDGCMVSNTATGAINLWLSFGTDLGMLVLMIFGLHTYPYRGSSELWKLLYRQGVIWTFVACMAYLPTAVLTSLNLNDAINLIWQEPACWCMIICATRMYRDLNGYISLSHSTGGSTGSGPLAAPHRNHSDSVGSATKKPEGNTIISMTTFKGSTGSSVDVQIPSHYGKNMKNEEFNLV